ncbi:MAG: hypothetical protein ACI8T1_001595 [Verrucomicrobiales bacterium]
MIGAYDEFLLMHYTFDEIDGSTVTNQGRLGGQGTLIGNNVQFISSDDSPTSSPAIEFANSEVADRDGSYVLTGLQTSDLGMTEDDPQFTITF